MKRTMRCFACCSSLVVWDSAAGAATQGAARLEYARDDRATACPDRDGLKAAVAKRLGYDPFLATAPQTVVVEITNAGAELHAHMHLVDDKGIIRGSRELSEHSEQCAELVASLALAISIALEPSLAPDTAAAGPVPGAGATDIADSPQISADPAPTNVASPSAASAPAPALMPSAPSPSSAPSQPAPPRQLGVRAQGFSALGTAPKQTYGWRLGSSMRWQRFKLIAEFAQQFPETHDLPDPYLGGDRTSLLAGNIAPCYARDLWAACALLSVGSFQSRGDGVPDPYLQHSLYLALGARLELTPQLLGPLHLLVNLDAQKSLTPLDLRLRDAQTTWKTPFLSGALGVGLEALFP